MKLLLEEKQKFTLPWVWLLIVAITSAALIPVTLSFFRNWPSQGDPGRSAEIVLAALLTYGSFIALYWLLLRACLETRITTAGLSFRFPPFIRNRRHIAKTDIKEYTVTARNPATTCGGRALHMYGKYVLQVVHGKKKKQCIGTRKPKALEAAMREMMQSEQPPSRGAN